MAFSHNHENKTQHMVHVTNSNSTAKNVLFNPDLSKFISKETEFTFFSILIHLYVLRIKIHDNTGVISKNLHRDYNLF